MSKYETSNQFNNGLIMDVHPLQTPNTVLTDCVNGTFITYNGNEHVLQNDMGNFKLSKCKLKENYIPIGTASYGDILYIASYNPVDDKFELGSYPSPLQWNSIKNDSKLTLYSIIDIAKENSKGDNSFLYSDLTKNQQHIVFNNSDLKLEPGDKYKINTTSWRDIENITYFIIDDNSVEHDVSVDSLTESEDEFKSVQWQIPGYFGIKNRILTPYSHTLTLVNAKLRGSSVHYKFRSKIQVLDDALCKVENLSNFIERLKFNIDTSINNIKFVLGNESNKDWIGNKYKSNTFTWLIDKKQIVCEYEFTIDYSGENSLFDETGHPKQVLTTITVNPVYVGDDYEVIYDNLSQSSNYTANGANISRVAEDEFHWNLNIEGNWDISFDYFKANNDDKISCWYEEFSNLKGISEKPQFNEINESDLPLSLPLKSDTLYLFVFSIEGSVNKTIGRWLFTTDGNSVGREDVDISLQDKLNEVYDTVNNIGVQIELEDVSGWKCTDSDFNKNLTSNNDVLVDSRKNTNIKFEHNRVAKNIQQDASNKKLFGKDVSLLFLYNTNKYISPNLGKDFNELGIEYKYKTSSNIDPAPLDGFYKDSNKWLCYNDIDFVKKIGLGQKSLCWRVTGYHDRSMFAEHYTNDAPGWIEISGGGYVGYADGYKKLDDSQTDLVLKNIIFNSFRKYIDLGVYTEKAKGHTAKICKTNPERDWMKIQDKAASKWKTCMPCYRKSDDKIYLVRFPGIESIVNNICEINFTDPDKTWKKQYLYTISDKFNLNLSMENVPSVYYTSKLSTDDTLLNWMFNGAPKDSKELGWFVSENVEYDSASKIEVISNEFIPWRELTIEEISAPSTDGLMNKISNWNEIVNEVVSNYKKYSPYYFYMEDIFDQIGYDVEKKSNSMYVYYGELSENMNRTMWNSDPNDWKKNKNVACIINLDGKPSWDNEFAKNLGLALPLEKIKFKTASVEVGYIQIYTYD